MSISGSSVHEKIRSKIREVENEHGQAEAKVYDGEKRISTLSDEREGIYLQLATVYLPELEAQDVSRTLTEVQAEVKRIFSEKQERRKELEALMQRTRDERKTLDTTLDKTTESLNQKAEERDKLKKQVADELAANQDYTVKNEKAKQAQARLDKNKERIGEVQGIADAELPTYESNRMFMYLVRKIFGTEEYNRTGLTGRLDSMVADLVHFRENKQKYDFLKAMPDLMKTELAKRQGELDEIVAKMEKIESGTAERAGLPQVIKEGKRIAEERAKLLGEIKRYDDEYKTSAQARAELDSAKDPYHIEAIQKLKGFLKGQTIQQLKERARATRDTSDDGLVDNLEGIDAQVRTMKDAVKTTKEKRDEVDKKLAGLKGIESKYTSHDFESRRSYFDSGLDVDSLLIGYLAGRMSEDHVFNEVSSSHHLKPVETYSSSSYSSSDHHSSDDDDGGSFGGFGGGSHSSGGGFGGGGFSSGSGF